MKKLLIIAIAALCVSCFQEEIAPVKPDPTCAEAQAEIEQLKQGLIVMNPATQDKRRARIAYLETIACND